MTRGNQRDLAREKNAKKLQQQKKSQSANDKAGNAGMSTDKRMDRDADVMRQKQQKADAAKEGQGSTQQKVVKIDPLKDL